MFGVTFFPVSLNDEFLYSSRSLFFAFLSLICVGGFVSIFVVCMSTCSSWSLLVSVDRYCPVLGRAGNLSFVL